MTGHPDPKLVETAPLWRCDADWCRDRCYCDHATHHERTIACLRSACPACQPCGFRVMETAEDEAMEVLEELAINIITGHTQEPTSQACRARALLIRIKGEKDKMRTVCCLICEHAYDEGDQSAIEGKHSGALYGVCPTCRKNAEIGARVMGMGERNPNADELGPAIAVGWNAALRRAKGEV